MNRLHFAPIHLPQTLLCKPLTGVYFINIQEAIFRLEFEYGQKVKLSIVDNNFIELGFCEIILDPSHYQLVTIQVNNLPLTFGYNWSIQRNNQWGPIFADPMNPRLAGQHTWRSQNTRFDTSFTGHKTDESSPRHFEHQKPRHLLTNLRIYECHVRRATLQFPGLDSEMAGTLEALPLILDHIQTLGFNAIELLPMQEFDENHVKFSNTSSLIPLVNFWGYMPLHTMALMRAYSKFGTSEGVEAALEKFVEAAHSRGIEVLMDVVFNHVDIQPLQGHLQTLPSTGFHHNFKNEFIDYTGCGNTLQVQNPILSSQILHILKYWAQRFNIDGFRFDLGGALARLPDGTLDTKSPFLERLSQDPVLSNLKLIIEPWDTGGAWLVGQLAPLGFCEWNDRFRDDLRRFINFGENKNLAATRLCGSSDLYSRQNMPCSLHYITCHDGFSLRDLVSYENRHNEANGESNRDGHRDNLSKNHGVEGVSDDLNVIELRERQMRNFMLALAVSHGPIMLTSGDEYGHSHFGNNNPWCQDGPLNALDWTLIQKKPSLMRYWQTLMHWRKQFLILESTRFYTHEDCRWYNSQGDTCKWSDEPGLLIFQLQTPQQRAFIIFNATPQTKTILLPEGNWQVISYSDLTLSLMIESNSVTCGAWTSALLDSSSMSYHKPIFE